MTRASSGIGETAFACWRIRDRDGRSSTASMRDRLFFLMEPAAFRVLDIFAALHSGDEVPNPFPQRGSEFVVCRLSLPAVEDGSAGAACVQHQAIPRTVLQARQP